MMQPELPLARLPKYQFVRLLGSGGMGLVYLARDVTLNRDVAIKVVAPEKFTDPGARRRLIREAKAAAGLDHPAICAVYEAGIGADDQAYIVMQYVEGSTLAERLEGGPLGVREALALMNQLAEALGTAHAHGIIHRDLKPQNIMITPSGRPKLLDFGIATAAKLASSSREPIETHTATTTGEIVGTPAYMSPEQVRQRPLDGRSDLFALGAVLFECLTGRRAFDAPGFLETCAQVVHVDPPAPSTMRSDLSDRHDELCRRMLAKDPADRFQSAEQLVGAIRVLLPDTGGPAQAESPRSRPGSARDNDNPRWMDRLSRRGLVVAAAVIAAIALIGILQTQRSDPLPTPPPDAMRWYVRGTEAVREGAYHSARLALEEAIDKFSAFPQAYAGLAEARSELGDEREAQAALLRVAQIVPDRTRLPREDRQRLDAVSALVLRDTDRAIAAYRALADLRPRDAGAWLDLGRAQDAAGDASGARESYGRALAIDGQYSAAHLRLGSNYANEARRAEALAAFQEAERLYRIASNQEGETEALLRRGTFLNQLGELAGAREVLERVLTMASSRERPFQHIRAQLQLSSLTTSEGRFADAERLAADAVATAMTAGLDAVAAGGLVALGTALAQAQRLSEAETHLVRAITLAENRGARRTAIRARLQYASLRLMEERYADARQEAERALESLRAVSERQYELIALSILSRALEGLGEYQRARDIALQVLDRATEVNDEAQMAVTLENLSGQSVALGHLPAALQFRERAAEIYRRQGDAAALPYDLTNRAELLIRLGRGDEAEPLLREVDRGVLQGIDAYVGHTRRVAMLRALRAAVGGRWGEVAVFAEEAIARSSPPDPTSLMAAALVEYATARRQHRFRKTGVADADGETAFTSTTGQEVNYWRLSARLHAGRSREVGEGALAVLTHPARALSAEAEWRLAALGAAAARTLGDADRYAAFSGRARAALERLRNEWKDQAVSYENRPDLVDLRRAAGLMNE